MIPERWLQVKEIFHEATELAPAERRTFLLERCDGDREMLHELELLIESHDVAEHFIERPALGSASDILLDGEANLWAGRAVGQYRVLHEIGRGGMGLVMSAARADDQFKKQVAIKILRRGMDSENILRRFRNERQILASLDHPNIARLLDGGITEDGLPYFVLEYIEGEPLDRYCDEHKLTTTERLELFQKICAVVEFAHQNLIIHRDLKPSNILITSEGEPKLLDFGIAKLLNPEMAAQTLAATATDLRLMTPEYASPEQIRGRNITTVSDVYSLGVLLYRLLTGHAPYRFTQASPQEIERLVCETEPEKPSTAIKRIEEITTGRGASRITPEAVAEARREQPEALRRRLQGDLDNIVLKALKKEPERRYSSAAQFSEDIHRYMEGLPVTARKDTFAYRASKFIARNRVGLAAASMVFVAILAGLTASIWEARLAREQRDRAQAQQAKAERITRFLTAALSYSNPYTAAPGSNNRHDATINQMLDDVAPRIEAELSDQPEVKASLERTIGEAYSAQTRFAEAERFLNAALEAELKIYGEDHLETARTLGGLSGVAWIKGDRVGAEKYLQRAIAIYRSRQEKGEVDVKSMASALSYYGDVLWSKGDYKAAEPAYRESVALASQLRGSDRELLASVKTGLGSNRYAQGRLDEAESLMREAVSEYRNQPQARLALAATLNPLAQVLMWEKKYDEALAAVRESESITGPLLGEDNYYFARSLFFEAYTLALKGEYAEAERVADKLEGILNRSFPDDKISKANLYDTRAIILTRSGRAAQGEKFGRLATEMYQSSMLRGANSITIARLHWAESLTAQKKYEEAEKILLEAYKDASEVQGTQHWRAKEAAHELAKLYEAWNRPNEAARYRPLY
jgi:serine/threonine protein kinase/Tfp pilus assembly protein PilF